MNDTGRNLPEKVQTLLLQQHQLVTGKRKVQMFPIGTDELNVLPGFERIETPRGAFHYNPAAITGDEIRALSANHRENELLNLGPYNKEDIMKRVDAGEAPVVITEFDPNGVEIKSAVGVSSTLLDQWKVFDQTKSEGSQISVEFITELLKRRVS